MPKKFYQVCFYVLGAFEKKWHYHKNVQTRRIHQLLRIAGAKREENQACSGPVSMGSMGLVEPIYFKHEVPEPINFLSFAAKNVNKDTIEAITYSNNTI